MTTFILDFERAGKIGFDCGWSSVTIHEKSIKKKFKEISESGENIDSNVVACSNMYYPYYTTYGFKVVLPNYRITNVQSTTIKDEVLRQVMKIVQIQMPEFQHYWSISSRLD